MNTRRLLIALANVLLGVAVGASTWRAYRSEVEAAAARSALDHRPVVSATWQGFLRFPGTEGIYVVAGMLAVAALAGGGLRFAARRRPTWLSLPAMAAFASLSPDDRLRVIRTVQDYLLVVTTLCVALVTFVTWHALGAATRAWPVPFGGDTRVGAFVALMVVLGFTVAATVLFYREYRERLEAALKTRARHGAQDVPPGT